MPLLWGRITWFATFAITLALAGWMRGQGFDWPATVFAAVVTFLALPFIISQLYAAVVLGHLKHNKNRYVDDALKLHSDAPKLLADYSRLHEKFPSCVIDISWLPAPKPTMKQAIQVGWLQAESEQVRNWLETGWLLLSWFQPGVGQIPIDISTKATDNIPGKQIGQYEAEKLRWGDLVSAEFKVLDQEFARFKQNPPTQAALRDANKTK